MKKAVYIFSNGELKRKQNTIFFTDGSVDKFIPIEDTSEIMLFGEVDFNKKVLDFLAHNQIILHLFNHYGYYFGSFYPREHLNSGMIILKQAEKYLNSTERLKIASAFVEGAVANIMVVISYYINRGKDLQSEKDKILALKEKIKTAVDTEQLMGFEGNARDTYYSAFDKILDNPDFKFEKRSRRPPHNSLNALISFCNSLIYVTALKQIYNTHLDPRIGYLHMPNMRSFSLNLDIAEIYKPIIADRMIFSLINKQMITKADFEEKLGGILLNESGRKKVIEEYDKRLQTTIQHQRLKRNVSYERLIRLECYKLEKHILGEEEYSPYLAKW